MIRVENVARQLSVRSLMLEKAFDIGLGNGGISIQKPQKLQPIVRCRFQPEPGVFVGNRNNGLGKRGKPFHL